ncbi:unnamed protein product [Acanthosepion pharaonis]|uniref:Uncharacterized protein n=1 Tax=Acanthosepion pharaonis TaxID=158019 RepID=A0A812F1D1_ACAPH|nr:unnamed protein product [Sepia pharaonis]
MLFFRLTCPSSSPFCPAFLLPSPHSIFLPSLSFLPPSVLPFTLSSSLLSFFSFPFLISLFFPLLCHNVTHPSYCFPYPHSLSPSPASLFIPFHPPSLSLHQIYLPTFSTYLLCISSYSLCIHFLSLSLFPPHLFSLVFSTPVLSLFTRSLSLHTCSLSLSLHTRSCLLSPHLFTFSISLHQIISPLPLTLPNYSVFLPTLSPHLFSLSFSTPVLSLFLHTCSLSLSPQPVLSLSLHTRSCLLSPHLFTFSLSTTCSLSLFLFTHSLPLCLSPHPFSLFISLYTHSLFLHTFLLLLSPPFLSFSPHPFTLSFYPYF